MSQFSVVASLRVVSVIYSAELTGPRFHAIVYCQFPMQWFQTSWETGIITRLRRMSSAVSIAAYKCSVTLCYSVRRRPSVSFVIFRSSLGHILLVLWCYFVLFLQHYNFIFRNLIFKVPSIDAVVLCVFCDSVLSLLYMCRSLELKGEVLSRRLTGRTIRSSPQGLTILDHLDHFGQ